MIYLWILKFMISLKSSVIKKGGLFLNNFKIKTDEIQKSIENLDSGIWSYLGFTEEIFLNFFADPVDCHQVDFLNKGYIP